MWHLYTFILYWCVCKCERWPPGYQENSGLDAQPNAQKPAAIFHEDVEGYPVLLSSYNEDSLDGLIFLDNTQFKTGNKAEWQKYVYYYHSNIESHGPFTFIRYQFGDEPTRTMVWSLDIDSAGKVIVNADKTLKWKWHSTDTDESAPMFLDEFEKRLFNERREFIGYPNYVDVSKLGSASGLVQIILNANLHSGNYQLRRLEHGKTGAHFITAYEQINMLKPEEGERSISTELVHPSFMPHTYAEGFIVLVLPLGRKNEWVSPLIKDALFRQSKPNSNIFYDIERKNHQVAFYSFENHLGIKYEGFEMIKIYYEIQVEDYCTLHATNMIVQKKKFTPEIFHEITAKLIKTGGASCPMTKKSCMMDQKGMEEIIEEWEHNENTKSTYDYIPGPWQACTSAAAYQTISHAWKFDFFHFNHCKKEPNQQFDLTKYNHLHHHLAGFLVGDSNIGHSTGRKYFRKLNGWVKLDAGMKPYIMSNEELVNDLQHIIGRDIMYKHAGTDEVVAIYFDYGEWDRLTSQAHMVDFGEYDAKDDLVHHKLHQKHFKNNYRQEYSNGKMYEEINLKFYGNLFWGIFLIDVAAMLFCVMVCCIGFLVIGALIKKYFQIKHKMEHNIIYEEVNSSV